jgi:hypothetical protein
MGDVRNLDQLARNIGKLASIPSRMAPAASREIATLIQGQFNAGVDPYGRPWAALKPSTLARGRRPPPLTHTGKMRGGITVKPRQGAGIEISFASDVPAIFHQYGTKKMAARPMLPRGVMPATWSRAIENVGVSEFRKAIK